MKSEQFCCEAFRKKADDDSNLAPIYREADGKWAVGSDCYLFDIDFCPFCGAKLK
jgi:hypothetical protein